MRSLTSRERSFVESIGLLSFLCLGLFMFRTLLTGHMDFLFVPGNLALAWLALVFSWLLVEQLRSKLWSSWQALSLTVLWLITLPNAWYVLTDYIHVFPTGEVSELFDITLISTLVFCGFLLGFASLYLVHKEFLNRVTSSVSWVLVTFVILVSSFAIYLGRDLRWNTWDVIANPEGIIINVSDRVLDPFGHPRALNVTLLFFVLLSVLYVSFWLLANGRPSAKSRR